MLHVAAAPSERIAHCISLLRQATSDEPNQSDSEAQIPRTEIYRTPGDHRWGSVSALNLAARQSQQSWLYVNM